MGRRIGIVPVVGAANLHCNPGASRSCRAGQVPGHGPDLAPRRSGRSRPTQPAATVDGKAEPDRHGIARRRVRRASCWAVVEEPDRASRTQKPEQRLLGRGSLHLLPGHSYVARARPPCVADPSPVNGPASLTHGRDDGPRLRPRPALRGAPNADGSCPRIGISRGSSISVPTPSAPLVVEDVDRHSGIARSHVRSRSLPPSRDQDDLRRPPWCTRRFYLYHPGPTAESPRPSPAPMARRRRTARASPSGRMPLLGVVPPRVGRAAALWTGTGPV